MQLELVEGRTYSLNGTQLEVPAGTSLILSSPGGGSTIDGEGLSRFFRVLGTLHVDNVRLVNGAASVVNRIEDLYGSYSYIPEVLGASVGGGALFVEPGAAVALTNVAIQGATAVSSSDPLCGGVFYVDNGATATLTNVTIRGVTAACSSWSFLAGGVFFVNINANATLTNVTIERARVTATSSSLHGGVFYVKSDATAALTDVTIEGVTATATSDLSGGVFYVEGTGATAALTDVTIEGVTATSSSDLSGGVFRVEGIGATAALTDVTIEGVTATASSDLSGGVFYVNSDATATLEHCTIANANATSTTEPVKGGCFYSESTLQLLDTVFTGCHAIAASIDQAAVGGCAYIGSGQLITSQGTSFDDCVADSGSTVAIQGGTAVYVLPAPPGRWVAAARCEVYRQACDTTTLSNNRGGSACPSVRDYCSGQTEQDATTVDGVPCEPLLSYQPCAWSSMPQLLGREVHSFAQATINRDYPYRCAAGLLGSNATEGQGTALCGGFTPAGTYQPEPGGLVALACRPGYYCPAGASAALPCPEGSYSSATNLASATECTPTDPGFSAPTGSVAQTPCPAGTIAPSSGLAACESCEAGHYQNAMGETACKPCERGSYCVDGAATPLPCPGGSFSSATNLTSATECISTDPGFYAPTGSTHQTPCRVDTFNPHAEQSSDAACVSCPTNSITDGEIGQLSITACVCKRDYYDTDDDLKQVNCSACPSGTDCLQAAGNTLVSLPVKRGYYRLHSRSIDVRHCPDAEANCSNAFGCKESTSGCRGTVEPEGNSSLAAGRRLQAGNSSLGCHDDLMGVFCRICVPREDGVRVHYSPGTTSRRTHCRECREMARDNIVRFIGFVALTAALILLLLGAYEVILSHTRKQQLRRAWQAFTPHNKLKILIGFYMIVTKVDDVYAIEMPAEVKALLNTFAIGISFGFNGLGSVLECLGMPRYTDLLALYIIAPLSFALLILLAAVGRTLCKRNRKSSALLETAVPLLLKLGFLSYPIVTNVAFEAFACFTFTESEWLKADVAVECGTAEHDKAKALAWVAIILYPIGLLALNGALLFAARGAIVMNRPTPLSRAIAFLYREYLPHIFWWELVEMLRRFVLVGLMVLAQQLGIMQLILGTLLSAAFLMFQVQASPYAAMADDFLATAASFGVVVVFLCSYAFKNHELVSLDDFSSKMSIEQEEYYVVNQSMLSLFMFAGVLGALILSFVLFLIQIAVEIRRLRLEAHEVVARRLCYKADHEQVYAPKLPHSSTAKFYHIFLSHVWGTGQDQMRVIKARLIEMIPNLVAFLDVDDLEEIGDLEGCIERTSTVLVYCSNGYFTSKNCMRELVVAVVNQKPLIALTDGTSKHRGGLTLDEIHTHMLEADVLSEKWDFLGLAEASSGANYQEAYLWPGGQKLHDALFASELVEWNRIGHFQDVTMRQIAERLLPNAAGTTYVDKEIVNQKLKPLKPPTKAFHVYCSTLNPGAMQLMREVARARSLTLHQEGEAKAKTASTLCLATEMASMPRCDHMLLYLTSQTWTRPSESAHLASEVIEAMDRGVHVLLVHEMTGVGQEARFGCEFISFFACASGATPPELLSRGIYSSIAVPLKGGPWRETSMMLLGIALGMMKEHANHAEEGHDVLGISADSKRLAPSLRGMSSMSMAEVTKRISSVRRAAPSIMSRRPGEISAMTISVSVESAAAHSSGGEEGTTRDLTAP